MKTLNNHTLIYDRDCPMCKIYTKGFIKYRMLDTNGRKEYNQEYYNKNTVIDIQKAKDKIALIDKNNNKVYYGIDSLLIILEHNIPNLKPIFRNKVNYTLADKFYKFISYNRKQIVPSNNDYLPSACTPSFNLKYRLLYITLASIFTAFILSQVSYKIWHNFQPNFIREFIIICCQIIWQTIFLKKYLKQKFEDYIGNLMTVSIIGSLLLIPLIYLNISENTARVYLFIVVTIMFLEYTRRCTILKIGYIPIISWVVYRIILLIVLLLIYKK